MSQNKFSKGQSFSLFLAFIFFLASIYSIIYLNTYYSIIFLTLHAITLILFAVSAIPSSHYEDDEVDGTEDDVELTSSDDEIPKTSESIASSVTVSKNDQKENQLQTEDQSFEKDNASSNELNMLKVKLEESEDKRAALEAKLLTTRQMLRELEASRSSLQAERNEAVASSISKEVCLFDYSLLKENEEADVVDAAERAISHLSSYARLNNVQISISNQGDRPTLQMNGKLLQILIKNIIDNSIKYMRRPGNLLITISKIESDIFFIFKDDGMGLPVEELEYIFDLNFQGSNRVSGNGLGLTQAKAIVTSYGGTIFAKSNRNQGMGIYIQLPMERNC